MDERPANGWLDLACETAEDCFRAARAVTVPSKETLTPEDRLWAQVERLHLMQERHPGSLWARRAGLLQGVLLAERLPEVALPFLRAAQRDLPLLEDYTRFWIAEALLRVADTTNAAELFESIPRAVPDTILGIRATYRAGEAWFRAGRCDKAMDLLTEAVARDPREPTAPTALLSVADCRWRVNQLAEGAATLREIWVRYPQAPDAQEAEARLSRGAEGVEWRPTPEDLYARAVAWQTLALQAEAAEEFQRFLSAAPSHPKRQEARLKLGTAFVRLKRYDQAREVFQQLAEERAPEAGEAAVWLARVLLRQGDGERLLAIPQTLPTLSLSAEQKAAILLFAGTWLEEQGQSDQALQRYRLVAQNGDVSGQRSEALWRIGWIHYRTGRFGEAVAAFQEVGNGKEDPQFAPQVLYWMARALEQQRDRRAADVYHQLCRQYALTYYCQLVRSRTGLPVSIETSHSAIPDGSAVPSSERRTEVWQDAHFGRALELRALGLDQDASRELASLAERYGRDREILLELSGLLSEVGAYYQALRLARLHFRDSLERNGQPVPDVLWKAAYPTGFLSTIKAHAGTAVDPYLVAAIIREESQYDAQAVSRVGAVGLMQVMPATAQAVAMRLGLPEVRRDDLFDLETNLRFGIRHLEELLQRFSGNLIHVVAAYNAGPTAVSAWIQKQGDKEADEFVELIPFQETRQYVKRVLRSYREYHRLGRSACDSRSLDKVC